jgi:hypothetical protein
MALPTLTKTWEIDKNRRIVWTGSETTHNQDTVLAIKELLVHNLGTWTASGWVVESCSDSSVVGNNDQVDRWLVRGDLVFNTGAHSWIVLKNTAINSGNFQICFDLNASSGFGGRNMNIFVSANAGFGAANGGADGTTSARPTATDERTIHSGEWADAATGSDYVLTTWRSTDGEGTRMTVSRIGRVNAFFLAETAEDPLPAANAGPGWVAAAGAMWLQSNSSTCLTYGEANDNTQYFTNVDGTGVACYITSIGDTSSAQGQNFTGVNDFDGAYEMGQMGIFAPDSEVPNNGFLGRIYDLRWVPTALADTDTFPDAAPLHQWIVLGDMALPFDQDPTFEMT